jgi:hypothetical protein
MLGIDPRYKSMACYNCGEPGHFVGICKKPKVCFICAVLGHYMTNCGVVVISKGEISLAELEKELSDIFYKDWSWQVRELTPVQFLVRFPPHKRVSDLKNLPSFNLRKEGVQVGVMEWIRELDHFSELREVWIQIEGIPPKWCDWSVFAQMASGFGLMLEVDWSFLFKTFYEKVRIKLACKNPRKIPHERLYEMGKKLFLVSITMEAFESNDKAEDDQPDDGDDNDQHGGGSDDVDDDKFDDLDDLQDKMDTDKGLSGTIKDKTPDQGHLASKGSKTVMMDDCTTRKRSDQVSLQGDKMLLEIHKHVNRVVSLG